MVRSVNGTDRNIQQISAGDRIINISYENILPGEYEKRVIFGNMCSSLVNMRCIFEGNSADIFYITGGLCRMDEYMKKEAGSTQSFLRIILNILYALRECGNYLIPENEISLKAENIFFSEMDGSARLLYMPGFRRETLLGKELSVLVEKAEKICCFGILQRDIMNAFKMGLTEAESSTDDMIQLTEEAMRRTFVPAVNESADDTDGERRMMMTDDSAEYITGKGIRRHLRDFINELVS